MKKEPSKLQNFFKERILEIVRNIPKGSVMTYKEVAFKAGKPNAFRAVGSIMKGNADRNVPCHRVVRSDKTAGQYNGLRGKSKTALLFAEGVILEGKTVR